MHQLIESKRNIERYIYNMGGDPDELASQIGVNRDTLLNENNWSDSTFSFNDNKFSLDVRYEDGVVKWTAV